MSALLSRFKDDGSIRGLFGGSSSDEDEEVGVVVDDGDDARGLVNSVKDDDKEEVEGAVVKFSSCLSGGVVIHLETNKVKGIAHQMWPASELFCRYMESHHSTLIPHPHTTTVLELGAGVGLCGLFMSTCLHCKSCLMTDLPEAIELLNKNINHNKSNLVETINISSQVLCWGEQDHYKAALESLQWSQDVVNDNNNELLIIAADCVYWECLYDPFLDTLKFFTSLGKNVRVIYSHVKRWKKENKFFKNCNKHFNVNVLYESVEYIQDEGEDDGHDVVGRKQISRIYMMTSK